MKKRVLSVLVTCLAMATMMSSCAPAKNTPTAPSSPKAEKLRFTFVCPIQGNVYWNTCVDGMNKAAEELGGIDINVVGPTQLDSTQFVKDLDSTIASKVDGIMIMCYDESMVGTSMDNAVNSGIPVVTIDTDGPNTKRAAYYGTANFDAGIIAGEKMVELTGGKAKIIISTADLAASNMKDRLDGFMSVIDQHPDMEVLTTVVAADVLKGAEVSQQFLTAYPEVTALYYCDGQGPKGLCQTLQERDLVGKLSVVTFDEDKELLDHIKAGRINATIAQDPYTMGYNGVKALKTLIEGGTIDPVVNNIPVVAITQDNVDEYLKKYE